MQTAVMLVLAIASLFLWGRVSAGSLLLGGLISILPNAYYAHKVFRHRGAQAMTRMVSAIYMGELIKLALMGAGFALAFKYVRPLNAIALFAGFVLVHAAGIAALATLQAPARK